MKGLIDQLQAARAVSTPLIAITTPDQPAIAQEITDKLNGKTPVVSWDRARGLAARNKEGIQALKDLVENAKTAGVVEDSFTVKDLMFASSEAASAMRFAQYLPMGSIIVAFSMDRFFRDESQGSTVQAILNLRDLFKSNKRTLIMLAPSFSFPSEIQHDVILLDDPLPTNEGYSKVVCDLHDSAKLSHPVSAEIEKITRAVRGLSGFEAEQVLAMSLALNKGKGIDLTSAWDLKKSAVSKIDGLTMTLDGPDVADLRGLDNVLGMLDGLWLGPEPPELVVRVDEIDKSMAGLGSRGGPGDNTGVTQDLNQNFLVNMEDNGWLGVILVGIRGSGKTVLTQSIGKKYGIPTISMDTGKMMKPHVGESQQSFREAFRTIKSIGGDRVIVFATCNRLDVLPPELLRRFKLGIVYFDLLTAEERDSLWPVYLKKYGHKLDSVRPKDEGWTGSEIRNCCEIAYKLRKPIEEVGNLYIVPVTKSDPVSVKELREQADSRFLSASYPGTYQKDKVAEQSFTPKSRKLNLGGN
jgi:hypothetical protein